MYMNSSKILLGFIAGAAVGGLLGVLFAPDKGEETRRRIAERGADLGDAVKDKFNDMVDGVRDGISSVRRKAEDVEEKAVSGYNRFKSESDNAIS
jgi:gas vesicle protein